MVINGGNKFIDLEHMNTLKNTFALNVDIQYLEDKPLIAIQGPEASALISKIIPDCKLEKLPFMSMVNVTSGGVEY